jgi:hypothetical protein
MADSFGYLRIVSSDMICVTGISPAYQFSRLTQKIRTLLPYSVPKEYLIAFFFVFLYESGKG